MNFTVRAATCNDFERLYKLCLATPEIQADPGDVFMASEEFQR